MTAAMQSLNASIDELLGAHGGARPLEQGEGDSFVAAFRRAADAVAFAAALQAAAPLPVRVGIHTGDTEVVDGGYAGSTIIRAARLRDAGHGGQVLLSQAAAALVADDVELDDLGEHHLKGLTRPEHIWQLPGTFPPLRLPDEPTIAPPRLTHFIGREVEMNHARDLVKEHGCVTLTGAGGAGKTRLAVELVAQRGSTTDAPSWFVDLAAVDDESGVAPAVADAVSAHSSPGRPPADSIAAIVRDRDAVIVFDNCEHVLAACSALASDLLGRCAHLTIVATSREPLGLTGEVTYRVPSLAEAEATALFVDCAQRADPRFSLDVTNAPVIAEICARLDGMPLAIELAAARMRVFSAQQLLDVLHDRFRLLTGGARTALPRQRTLEASVDWSHALLLDAERVLLRRLSVFAGGFSLDAAVAVAADGELEMHHVFDLLVQLVEKSLVTTDEAAPGRFRMLETIRHYAAARLVDAAEADGCRRRHYEFFVRLLREDDSGSAHELGHLRAIRVEEANLRRAVQWAADQPGYELLCAIALPASHYWRYGRRTKEAATVMLLVNERTRQAPAAIRARVLTELASAIGGTGAYADAAPYAREAIALSAEAGDDRVRMYTLLDCQTVLANAEGHAPELLDEVIAIAEKLGDEKTLGLAVTYRGFFTMRDEGDFERGSSMLRDGVAFARKHGMDRLEGVALAWLCMGGVFVEEIPLEDFDRAAELLEATNQGMVLANLYAVSAIAHLGAGDEAGCERNLVALDTIALEMNDFAGSIQQMTGHSFVAFLRGDAAEAVRRMTPFATVPWGTGNVKALLAFMAVGEALMDQLDDADAHATSAADYPYDANGLLRGAVAVARTEVALRRGDYATAFELALGAATSPDVTRSVLTNILVGLVGRAAFHLGRPEETVRVMSAAGFPDLGLWHVLFDDTISQCRSLLGDEKFDTLWAEGAALTFDEALALVQRGRGSRQRPMLGWDSLTPTEAEVAALVAQGMSNKDVAAQLFMSEATVKTHLTRIYAKVGVSNRAQLAAAHRSS
jgi:predicted ATPase/DNA-binding CsgD family transcriptional regulator